MLLDFAFLSMTELRNTPGEILDRVAEAKHLSSNGAASQSMPRPAVRLFPDIAPARIAAEFDELSRAREQARPTITENLELAIHLNANPPAAPLS